MVFHFQCPQGHLLEGDESQAGQPCHCPVCQVLFLIPPPLAAQEAPPPAAAVVGPGGLFNSAEPADRFAESHPAPVFEPKTSSGPELLYIPCPKGHELEVPREMLGQDVLCPHCNAQFQLKEKNSIQFKRRQAEDQVRRDLRTGSVWLHWAIIIAVLVVLGLIGLIASSR